ncbi:MAG: hypothetical protein A2580_08965 [Hydrogenophilales bacterium RIFOXYD1_FULL_62_11]|nr:MAG: hypothetical protein A2580_08965 [Hydrogenophilales bacterium RIFOXYD1_FULL_62_11]
MTSPCAALQERIIAFLAEIGLDVHRVDGVAGDSFALGVSIHNGTLLVAPEAQPSCVLHEAGHLAVTPACFRPLLDGNLYRSFRSIEREMVRLNLEPEHPLVTAVINSSDPEATAWAWAAGVHLGLNPELIIQDVDYDGEGADVRLGLQHNAYCGIHGLAHGGMCLLPRRPGGFPTLKYWLQPAVAYVDAATFSPTDWCSTAVEPLRDLSHELLLPA